MMSQSLRGHLHIVTDFLFVVLDTLSAGSQYPPKLWESFWALEVRLSSITESWPEISGPIIQKQTVVQSLVNRNAKESIF